jgi:hypothetical protein
MRQFAEKWCGKHPEIRPKLLVKNITNRACQLSDPLLSYVPRSRGSLCDFLFRRIFGWIIAIPRLY